ncbi:MAG: hypothetical protein HKN21_17255, partial [Candidatus Eisenbacteria bacterium]|nr:hypothetical protein [Candidatus Eisenbacteria bacterium]
MKSKLRFLICVGLLAIVAFPGSLLAQSNEDAQYEIGPDDTIQIQIWQRPDLSGTYVVDEQGKLNLPLIGLFTAEGKTAGALGKELERRFVIMDPGVSQVLVTVTGFNSRRFTVVGEVRAPGVYTFRKSPSLWDVILTAGGETPNADMSEVQIVRELGGGEVETINVDLSGGLNGTPSNSIPALKPGDSIVISSVQTNAVVGDQVQVLGAVRAPGVYSLKSATTVVEAVSVAGGHMESADLRKVKLARRGNSGAVVYGIN